MEGRRCAGRQQRRIERLKLDPEVCCMPPAQSERRSQQIAELAATIAEIVAAAADMAVVGKLGVRSATGQAAILSA